MSASECESQTERRSIPAFQHSMKINNQVKNIISDEFHSFFWYKISPLKSIKTTQCVTIPKIIDQKSLKMKEISTKCKSWMDFSALSFHISCMVKFIFSIDHEERSRNVETGRNHQHVRHYYLYTHANSSRAVYFIIDNSVHSSFPHLIGKWSWIKRDSRNKILNETTCGNRIPRDLENDRSQNKPIYDFNLSFHSITSELLLSSPWKINSNFLQL